MPRLAKAMSVFIKYKTASKEDKLKLNMVEMMTSSLNYFCFLIDVILKLIHVV
jgi:hypothetical protein